MDSFDAYRQRVRTQLSDEDDSSAQVFSLQQWHDFRTKREPQLSSETKRKVVAQAISTFEGLYVHRDLKRARRGVDPVRQLRMLAERLEGDVALDNRPFHNRMLEIFKTLGDVHTAYRLPEPYISAIAFLPFLVGVYRENHEPKFVVTRVSWKSNELDCGAFDRDVEVVTWNGAPMKEAVRRSADFEEGSNEPHDFTLALQFMTVRWLGASFEPDSPWVVVGYREPEHPETILYCQFFWSVFFQEGGPKLLVSEQAKARIFGDGARSDHRERAVHVASQVVHATRKRLFTQEDGEVKQCRKDLIPVGLELRRLFNGFVGRTQLQEFTRAHSGVLKPAGEGDVPSLLPLFFEARIHRGAELIERGLKIANDRLALSREIRASIDAGTFGYIRIRAFALEDPEAGIFRYEFRRLLNLMIVDGRAVDGLIIDIRDNPGGSSKNAEQSLQFLTANPITPLPFRFLASTMTKEVTHPGAPYIDYRSSIVDALGTGGVFSAGRPITDPALANGSGQHYFGPVLLVTSGTTYSAGDIFAAGFQDNGLGPILGIDETTGAGGANCWFYNQHISPILDVEPLPDGINLQMAVRQCTRVGKDNGGIAIEEVGIPVKAELRYELTRGDVIQPQPWGLLLRAASELVALKRKPCDMHVDLRAVNDALHVEVRADGFTRLDFYVEGRPDAQDVNGKVTRFPLDATGRIRVEIQGFGDSASGGQPSARYIQMFDVDTELAKATTRAHK